VQSFDPLSALLIGALLIGALLDPGHDRHSVQQRVLPRVLTRVLTFLVLLFLPCSVLDALLRH
jgi:hypothetical protein